jgi:hypothetical protein
MKHRLYVALYQVCNKFHTHTHIHKHTHTHTQTHTHRHTHKHTHTQTHRHTNTHTHRHTNTHTNTHTHTRARARCSSSSLSLIRRTACARAQFSACSSTTNAHSETGQMAICCQNLPLGALSSRSAPSVPVGELFKKFGLFLTRLV